MKELNIEIEELEPKVAPSAHGQLGYEGQRPLRFVSEWRGRRAALRHHK